MTPQKEWKFSEILSDPEVKARWEKVRKYFFLRESTYDMTRRCNIRCEGCYYFEGDKQDTPELADSYAWRRLMKAEKERGITFVVLAGAEPSLVPRLLETCHDEIPLGAVATNGLKKIPETIGYKLHVSVWGNDETSRRIRHADNMIERQIANYRNDPRAVFVYTFTRDNIDQAAFIARRLRDNHCRMTFNMFSAPMGYDGPLKHDPKSLAACRETMRTLSDDFPDTVLYSYASITAHTHTASLNDLYGCSYPRMNPATDIGLGRSFRHYRTDLSWNRAAACCVPDTDCLDCRHYAAGSAIVTARLFRHVIDPPTFQSWLDYVDTYLAVWVTDYEKSDNLCRQFVPPPGRTPAA